MKIGKVTTNEPTERLAVSLKQSSCSVLKAYKEHYLFTYGEEITMNQMVETMLVDYMKQDKNFQKRLAMKPVVPVARAEKKATEKVVFAQPLETEQV